MKQPYFSLSRLDLPEFELFLAITGSSFDEKQNVVQYSHHTPASLTFGRYPRPPLTVFSHTLTGMHSCKTHFVNVAFRTIIV